MHVHRWRDSLPTVLLHLDLYACDSDLVFNCLKVRQIIGRSLSRCAAGRHECALAHSLCKRCFWPTHRIANRLINKLFTRSCVSSRNGRRVGAAQGLEKLHTRSLCHCTSSSRAWPCRDASACDAAGAAGGGIALERSERYVPVAQNSRRTAVTAAAATVCIRSAAAASFQLQYARS